MSNGEFQVREIEKALRRKPAFMDPCVTEQGVIVYPKRSK